MAHDSFAPSKAAESGLPAGWIQHTAADGRVYYQAPTGETTWTAPTGSQYAVPPPPPSGYPSTPPAGYPQPPAASDTTPEWSSAPGRQGQKKKPSTGKVILGTLAACFFADAIF